MSENRIGEVIDRVEFTVERGKVREFVAASHTEDPIHTDAEVARTAGFPAPVATPTHAVVAGHYRDQSAFVALLGLDRTRVVVGEVSWTYHRPAVVGDVLTGDRRLVADETRSGRRGGDMRVLTLTTSYVDPAGNPVVTVEETIIERGSA